MQALSSSTLITDPYRAGLALGESLRPLSPEVVFLFSSIHLSTPELVEGLYDALENDNVIVIGNTGDGFFETSGVSDFGAAALGLNSEGKVRWQLERIEGLHENFEVKFEQLMAKLASGGETPCLGYLVCDFRVDLGQLEPILCKWTHFPIVGGLATDDRRRANCSLYVNRAVLDNAMAILVAYGDLHFSITLGNTQQTIGRVGRVDDAEGALIRRVDGIGAMDFMERETGKPVLQTDRGILSILVCNPDATDEKRLRAVVPDFSSISASLRLFGDISKGYLIQVCLARPEDMVANVQAIARTTQAAGKTPVAALIVSCTGRKAVLGSLVQNELSALSNAFPQMPLAGFPSSGEIAPLINEDGYTRNLFHNMTYVLLLIEQ